MKRLYQPKFTSTGSRDSEENVLPLINIVFLLLIFFLMAGAITTPDIFEVSPPSNNESPELGTERVILMAKDGRYAYENTEVSLDDLPALIRAAAGNNAAQKFKIKADASVHSGKVIAVMEMLRNAGVKNTTLITQQDD